MQSIFALMTSQVIIKVLGLFYKLYLTNRNGFGDEGNAIANGAYQVFAIHFMALAQATDILAITEELAPATQTIYRELRCVTDSRIEDKPFYEDIERIIALLKEKI